MPARPAVLPRLAVPALVLAMLLTPSLARADGFGQLGSFLAPGSGPADLHDSAPIGFASDPADGSFFVLDFAAGASAPQLRRFSPSGALQQTQTVPVTSDATDADYPFFVAVDHARNRVYVVINRAPFDPTAGAASKILAFAADTLTPQSDVAVPTGGNAIRAPFGLAVDPVDGHLRLGGYTDASQDTAVVQDIDPASGPTAERFVDAANVFHQDPGSSTRPAAVLSGSDGAAYVVTASSQIYSSISRIAPDLGSATHNDKVQATNSSANLPPALSTDGKTLYTAADRGTDNDVSTPDDWRVVGTSLADGSTSVVYGGGTTQCVIANGGYGVGVAAQADGTILALDPPNIDQNTGEPNGTAGHVLKFGSGGSGCPTPSAAFAINGSTAASVTLQKGTSVTYDATSSNLNGATPKELDWDLDGSGAFATVVTGSPAALTTTAKALTVGTYTVSLRLKVDGAYGDPPVVTRKLTVTAGTPTASFSASTRTPVAGAAVSFDASASIDPTGSSSGGPTNTLKTYSWDFGDGSAVDTTSGKLVSHAFANGGGSAVSRTVKLTVTSADGVTSTPVSQTVNVQGTPAPSGDGGGGDGGTPSQPQSQPQPQTPSSIPQATTPVPRKTTVPAGAVTLAFTKPASGRKVSLRLSCSALAPCSGQAVLSATVATKVKGKTKRTKLTLAAVPLSLAAGKSSTVTLTLASKLAAALKAKGKLGVAAVVATRDGAGAVTPRIAALALTLAKTKTKTKKT